MDKVDMKILSGLHFKHEADHPADHATHAHEDMRGSAATAAILEALGEPERQPNGDRAGSPDQILVENIRLQRLLDAYQAALDRHAIVAITDPRGKIAFVNAKFCSISGYSSWELLGRSHNMVNSGYHPRSFFSQMWQVIAGGEVWHGEICNRAKSGDLYWVDTTVVPVLDRHRRVEAYVSIRYDITKRKLAEESLHDEVNRRRNAEALLLDVVETVPDAIAAFDAEDRLILHNQAYLDCFDRSREAIEIGATFEAIVRHGLENGQYVLPRNSTDAKQAWLRARLLEHASPGKKSVQALTGGRWLLAHERRSASGNIIGTRTDITELKRHEATIKYNAEHDSLTRLYNRSVLGKCLSQAVAGCSASHTGGALIVADLDGFKQINDTLGHAAGDALLVAVARRLEKAVRKTDTIIRLGGDEFAIIVPQADKTDIPKLGARLLKLVQQPFSYQGQTINPRLSMGASLFPRDGRKIENLLKKADLALYQTKAEGGRQFRVFSRSLCARNERQQKLSHFLAAAVSSDQIEIAMQPQFLLSDASHSGFETLARWSHAGQSISPAEFIPIAEERGLIIELGKRVIQRSLQTICRMKRNSLKTGRIAVNVAAAQIRMREFPLFLKAMVDKYGLAPDDIEVELTENILLDRDHLQIAQSLQQLRQMGFSIALDDFGTGYASLAHLSRFPINKIKIDRTFINEMLTKQGASTIVRAMIGLAHNLGMQVVAEGIETHDQLEELRAMNCDFGQGFLVSPPLTGDEVQAFLKRNR